MFTEGLVNRVAFLHKKRLLFKCAGSLQLNLLVQIGQLRVRVNTENVFLYANGRSHFFYGSTFNSWKLANVSRSLLKAQKKKKNLNLIFPDENDIN